MRKLTSAMAIALACAGCMTEPKIESTKPWEKHYFTVQELKESIESIQLDKDESMWLMSNYTLKRLLKNTRK